MDSISPGTARPTPPPVVEPMRGRHRSDFILSAVWIVPVLVAAAQKVARGRLGEGPAAGWGVAIVDQLPLWAPLFVLTPSLLIFIRRVPFDRARLARSSFAYGSAILLASFLFLVLSSVLAIPIEGRQLSVGAVSSAVGGTLIRSFHLRLFMIGAVVAAGFALENERRLRERRIQAFRLSGQLAEARLATLSTQLQPHFLFNTLHSIASLVDDDPKAAQEMIAALGDLLRHSLQGADRPTTSLHRELEVVDLYLAIEQVRFQDRLRVERDLAAEALSAELPTLLLQPLVENAIRHGIARRQQAGRLVLRARVEADRVEIVVQDDGAGLAAWEQRGRPVGVGLRNTRQRIEQLYGEDASLALEPVEPHGTRVRVTVPYRLAEDLRDGDRPPGVLARRS